MQGTIYLVTYTILSQAAIGLVIMLFVASRVLGGEERNKRNYKIGFLISTVLILLAMVVSGMHLGNPLRAMNALINIKSSWLSREILLTGLFFACSLLTFYRLHKNKKIYFTALTGSVSGLFCVISQAEVYANTIIPVWGNGHSYITFIGATMALGAFLGVLILCKESDFLNQVGAKHYIMIAMIVGLTGILIQAGFYSIFAGPLAQTGKAGIESLGFLSKKELLMVIRWLCSLLALIGLGISIYKKEAAGMLYIVTFLIFMGEVLDRSIFYGMGISNGL